MARYTKAVCRLCRREQSKLFLKGERCYTDKCAFERRTNVPGQLRKRRGRAKISPYGQQLREKQKVRRIYGVFEKQFKKTYKVAERMKGITGESLLQLLECRLDNIVFRLGFSVSRSQARQLVRHRHILVNGNICDIPSYMVKIGDIISIKEKSRNLEAITYAIKANQRKEMLSWLSFNPSDVSGQLLEVPSREAIPLPVNEQMIVELYSK